MSNVVEDRILRTAPEIVAPALPPAEPKSLGLQFLEDIPGRIQEEASEGRSTIDPKPMDGTIAMTLYFNKKSTQPFRQKVAPMSESPNEQATLVGPLNQKTSVQEQQQLVQGCGSKGCKVRRMGGCTDRAKGPA